MKKYIALCLAWLCLSGCLGSSIDFTIDNPTDQKISLTIDDKFFEILPKDEISVSLEPGRHYLKYASIGKVSFIVYANMPGGVINPTLSRYVHVSEIYATDDKAAQRFSPLNQKIMLDSVEFSGPYTIRDGLFLDKDWSYGIHEDFPDSISVRKGQDGNIKTKLFTQSDFVRYYEGVMGSVGYYEKNKKSPSEDKSLHLNVAEYKFPVFADKVIYEQALKIEQALKKYVNSEKFEEQVRIQKDMHFLIMDFTRIYAEKSRDLSPDEHRKHADITANYRNIMSKSAAIVSVEKSQ